MRKLVLIVLLCCSWVLGADLTVCADGCDYTTLQAAVNACEAGANTITVTPGTYNVAGTVCELTASQNGKTIAISSSGAGATFTGTGIGVYANNVSSADATCVVSFSNIHFATTSASGVIRVKAEPKLTFARCALGGGADTNHMLAVYDTAAAGTARELTLQGCTITVGSRVFSGGHLARLVIDDCTPSSGTVAATGGLIATGAGVRIDNLQITDNAIAVGATNTNAVINLSALTVCSVARIEGNTITQTGSGYGIHAEGYIASLYVRNNTVVNNHATAAGVGIYLGTDTTNNANPLGRVIVEGNTVSHPGADNSHGILIGPGCVGADVLGNSVFGADIGLVIKGDCTVDSVKRPARARIIGNKVYGPRGIYLKGSSGNYVAHNTAKATEANAAAFELIADTRSAVAYASTDNTVVDNIFDASGGTAYAFRDYDTTGPNVRNRYDYNVLGAGTPGAVKIGSADAITTKAGLVAMWASDLLLVDNDANSIVGDPLLGAPSAGVFSLGLGSPAMGAASDGTNIGAWQSRTSSGRIMPGRIMGN